MRVVCALLLCAAAAPADAGVVVGEGVPFTGPELEEALAARRPAAVVLALEVRAAGPDRVQIVGIDDQWEVEVGRATGAAAARLVALNVLGRNEPEVALPPPAPPRRPLRVTAAAGASRGVDSDDLAALGATVEVSTGRRWWFGLGFEWREALEVLPPGADPLDARTWLVRGLAGRSLGPVELGAGPVVGRLTVDSGTDAHAWQTGLSVVARAALPMAAHWSVVIGATTDAYRHRVEVMDDDRVVATTPRIAIGATVGVRWEHTR